MHWSFYGRLSASRWPKKPDHLRSLVWGRPGPGPTPGVIGPGRRLVAVVPIPRCEPVTNHRLPGSRPRNPCAVSHGFRARPRRKHRREQPIPPSRRRRHRHHARPGMPAIRQAKPRERTLFTSLRSPLDIGWDALGGRASGPHRSHRAAGNPVCVRPTADPAVTVVRLAELTRRDPATWCQPRSRALSSATGYVPEQRHPGAGCDQWRAVGRQESRTGIGFDGPACARRSRVGVRVRNQAVTPETSDGAVR